MPFLSTFFANVVDSLRSGKLPEPRCFDTIVDASQLWHYACSDLTFAKLELTTLTYFVRYKFVLSLKIAVLIAKESAT